MTTQDSSSSNVDILQNVKALLNLLHQNKVVYCHFKSNLHVVAGLIGETDLDILIDRTCYLDTVNSLTLANFKRFQAKLPSNYPAVEDWLGFDNETGKLVHLHLHWQLVAGEASLKGYRIPWETEVLSTRVFDENNNVYIASPEMEILLLLVRAVLKYRFRDTLGRCFGRQYPDPNGDIVTEYTWLKQRFSLEKTKILASKLLSPQVASVLDDLLTKNGLDSSKFHKLHPLIRQQFLQYKTYSTLMGNLFRWYREGYSKVSQVISRKFGCFVVRRRVPATGGLIIAFMGADGSGKSTQVKQTMKWLGWKLDVGYVYFGSGDGPVSWLRRPLVMLGMTRKQSTVQSSGSQISNSQTRKISFRRRVFVSLWALTLILEKQGRLTAAIRARNKGMVVVCDRFPQNQFSGFNDGPIMSDWLNEGWPWANLARYELKKFEHFNSVAPDLVIKLHVSESVSASRKIDTPPAMITKKINVIRKLSFGPETKLVELDADFPLADVTLFVRRAIWSMF